MKVKPEQVADGIIAFADAELLPAMDGWQLWTATAALVLARQRIDILLSQVIKNKYVSMLGIVDESGMVDVDNAILAAKEATKKQGKVSIDLPMIGIMKFEPSDFDKLKEYILQSAE